MGSLDMPVGSRWGRLVVKEVIYPRKRRDQWRLRFQCDCGREVILPGSVIKRGDRKSCGCYRRDRMGKIFRSHGKSKTPEFLMFYDARKRAVSRGTPFSIQPTDIVIPTHCPILGIELRHGAGRENVPSLDCIRPELGYVLGNICVISFRANRIKSDATSDELEKILAYTRSSP
jgi:hypothetical protein